MYIPYNQFCFSPPKLILIVTTHYMSMVLIKETILLMVRPRGTEIVYE
jgi:hypothetical protein